MYILVAKLRSYSIPVTAVRDVHAFKLPIVVLYTTT